MSAARRLLDCGLAPIVYDKSRGIGGRMATRRVGETLQFDHGAPYLSSEGDSFSEFLNSAKKADSAKEWAPSGFPKRVVGLPGMSTIVKYLARGATCQLGEEIDQIRKLSKGWLVANQVYDRVICAVPAPQAAKMLASQDLKKSLSGVVMAPRLTLMLAVPSSSESHSTFFTPGNDVMSLALLDNAKTSRSGPRCWVAHATVDWSRSHLDLDKQAIAESLMPIVCDSIGCRMQDSLYVDAHKWRFALTEKPLGRPFLTDGRGLFIGGDWTISDRAEAAWISGLAMADAVLASS